MSLKKSLLKNGFATAIQKIVRVLEQLLLVPFFITAWGTVFYGEWITLTIIPTMLAFSDLGFGSAAANTFVLRYASDDKEGAADVAKSAFFILTIAVIASGFIGAIALVVLNYFNVFSKSVIPKYDAMWSVSILMLARILNFYQELFDAHYRSARRAALSTNLVSAYSAATIAASIICLAFKSGIIIFALANLAVSVIFNAYYGWRAEHLLKLNKEFKGKINRADIKSVSSKGFGYLLSPIWQSVFFQGTTFVVRLSLGPAAVTIFNTVRTVSRSANQAYGMVNLTVFPELQFEIGAGRMAKARQLFRMAMGSVIVIAVLGMLFLFVAGPWVYKIWTKGLLHPPSAMWNIFIIGIGFNALWWTAGMVFRAVNQPYRLAISGFIAAVLSIVLSYFLSLKLGLTGAAIGSLVLDAFMAFYVLPITCKLLGQELKTLPADIVNDIKEVYHKFKKKAVTQEA